MSSYESSPAETVPSAANTGAMRPGDVPPAPRRGRFLFGLGCGCLLGLVAGIALAAGAFWAPWYAFDTYDPLAELRVEGNDLTLVEARPYIDKLAQQYLAEEGNVGLVVGAVQDGERGAPAPCLIAPTTPRAMPAQSPGERKARLSLRNSVLAPLSLTPPCPPEAPRLGPSGCGSA